MSPSWLDSALDASIVFSFDASGFRRHARRFTPGALDVDLSGRVCLVTGANGGIGLEVARTLARMRADVHLLCRDLERGRAALEQVRAGSPQGRVELAQLDVSSLASVRSFVESWSGSRVDALVHNAGLIPESRILTPEGMELTLATHVVGPFLLSRLLEKRLAEAQPGRVIWVSSGGMYTHRLSLADVDWSEREYGGVSAYAQTKRMQVVLSELLAEHWKGKGIVSHAMHPGWAGTPGLERSLPGFTRLLRRRLRTPAQGADTIVWLAASDEAARSSGLFWLDRQPVSTHFLSRTREADAERRALWDLCEERAGLRA